MKWLLSSRCERVPTNISEAIGLLRRVTSSHNAAEAAGQQPSEAGNGQGEAVTMGLEATMVDMESLLLHCCHQERVTLLVEVAGVFPSSVSQLLLTG